MVFRYPAIYYMNQCTEFRVSCHEIKQALLATQYHRISCNGLYVMIITTPIVRVRVRAHTHTQIIYCITPPLHSKIS